MADTPKTLRSEFEALERRPVQDDDDAWGMGREALALCRHMLDRAEATESMMVMFRTLILERFNDPTSSYERWKERVQQAFTDTEAAAHGYEARVQAAVWDEAATAAEDGLPQFAGSGRVPQELKYAGSLLAKDFRRRAEAKRHGK